MAASFHTLSRPDLLSSTSEQIQSTYRRNSSLFAEIGFALSLSNLCFLRLWAGAPPLATHETLALLKVPPHLPYFAAAWLNLTLGCLVILWALSLQRSTVLGIRVVGRLVIGC